MWKRDSSRVTWRSLGFEPTSGHGPMSTSRVMPPLGNVYSSFALHTSLTCRHKQAKECHLRGFLNFISLGKENKVFPSHRVEIYIYIYIYI